MPSEIPASVTDQIIASTCGIDGIPDPKLRTDLIAWINELIRHDFQALVQLLYRVDISEEKIRKYLVENHQGDPAPFMADLIIERQLQKAESRKRYILPEEPSDEEEKW